MVDQQFCLRWNNYRTNITAEFETLREGEHFVDVTLACDGRQLKAHKVVLSACSPYFKELLQGNPCSHPIIILRDVAYTHMRSLLEFMYAGEVNISQAHLSYFLHTAEALKIRGLAESEERKEQNRGNNNLSPLSALKTSLGNFGGLSFGGLGPSLLEHSLIPQLIPHSGDTSSNPSLVPPNVPPSGFFTTPPAGRSSLSQEKSQTSLSLTVSDDLCSRHLKGEASERKEPSSPLSLPPNKRIRIDSRLSQHSPYKDSTSGDKCFDSNSHNGCSFTPHSNDCVSPIDTATSKMSTNASNAAFVKEDSMETIPKTEPLDPPVSDHEGSGSWPDDGDTAGGLGRESPTDNAAPPNAESPSQLLHHALSSDSHLPGPSFPMDSDRSFGAEDARQESRQASSPPMPPSSLPHSCQLCGKMISCRRNLWKHMERVHFTNPAVRCSLCAKMFKNKYALKDHQRIYHGGLSEPSQLAPPQHSLLSRILQDPRHLDVPPPPAPHHSYGPSRLPPEDQEHPQVSYSSSIMPPPIVGTSRSHPNADWTPQENLPYSLVNRSLLSELHHLVTKAD